MNIQLLNEHVKKALANVKVEQLKSDGSNANRFFCADVVGNKRFAQNYGGYPRSEIAEINAQANEQLAMSMLAQLRQVPVSDATSGMTDAQIMLGHKSKYLQAPSEMQGWLMDQLAVRDAERAKLNPPKDDTVIHFEQSNVETNE